jgi:ferric-dicitrate binding protein FerR (iron transport regulator)
MDESLLLNELLHLALVYHRGEATEEETARLERLLADDPGAIDAYLCIVCDTLTLREAAEAKATQQVRGRPVPASEVAEPGGPRPGARRPLTSFFRLPARRRRSLVGSAAACVLLLISGGAWLWWSSGSVGAVVGQQAAKGSARVVNISKVHWSEGAKQYNEWSFVAPGDWLKFDSGVVDLFLSNGVELLVEGPADVQFVSLRKVMARQGKLAARVAPGATGFSVQTPHAHVIDRGTAFGLSVDANSRTVVVVYDGKVDLDVLGDRGQPRRRLETGEALSVDQQGQLSRITTSESAEFLELPQMRPSGALRARVITSVSDNMHSLETTKYYRVVPRGFQEDCPAYVDRQFEWNGLDERGIPPFLLGGDYVMTFNDDKIVTEIQIAVAISQPAHLYVLLDDRVPPPEWLKRGFVDTNWDIGSDEGYPDGSITAATGPGKSIDHVCSIWRRDVLEAGTVVLGALSGEKSTLPAREVERSMYGVVATPLLHIREK